MPGCDWDMVGARVMTIRPRPFRFRAALIAACALLASSAAQAQYIDLPGTQPGGLGDGAPLDSARSCGVTCHYSRDVSVPSAMPYDTWAGSMMGNSMRDPLFLAALTIAEQDRPGVGDWCLRCHTPPGFVGGRTRSTATAPRGTALESADLDGVTCDSCHRMVETPNPSNAQYVLSPTETRFGPYPVIESIRHPGATSTWLADSRMCATCHEITNPVQPLRRADGTDTGQRFPLDTTFSEWSRSAFAVAGSPDAATCQDCHMPRLGEPGLVSTNNTAIMRDNPRGHDFAGANYWALRMLGAMRNDVTTGEFYDPEAVPFYEAGARRAEASLRSAVSVEVRTAPATAMPSERVEIVARITNRIGHRVPAGYADGRRVWLDVTLIDSENRETVVSGAYDNAAAHLDVADTQLKLYEAQHGRAGMGRGEHIALHDTIVRDTRLPPRGYRPLPGHEPVGVDYAGGEGGALRHWDDARYSFTVPATARGPMTVRVRARYQVTTREYVEFLARENRTDDRGRDLLRLYEASGRAAPFDMAVATAIITLPGGATADAGVADGGASPAEAGGGCSCRAPGGEPSTHGRSSAVLLVALAAAVSTRRRRRAA